MITTTARPHRPSLLGVLYAEDFDDDGVGPASADPSPLAEPEMIEPVFTAAEVEAVRLEARQAGLTDAECGLASARHRLLAALTDALAEAREAAQEAAANTADEVARCMMSALAACLPKLCERHGEAEVRSLVGALLPALSEEPKVLLRVNPQMIAALREDIAALDPDHAERVHLLPSEVIPPGDARVTWTGGSAVRDSARACAAFQDGLAALGLFEERADD